MTNNGLATFESVIVDVFENQAFMFGECMDKLELEVNAENFFQVTITFGGSLSGKIDLITTQALCEELAANMLGLEPDDEEIEEAGPDALKELANVVCGQFLTAQYGSGLLFELSIPVLQNVGSNTWKAFQDQADTLGFFIDEMPLLACLTGGAA